MFSKTAGAYNEEEEVIAKWEWDAVSAASFQRDQCLRVDAIRKGEHF